MRRDMLTAAILAGLTIGVQAPAFADAALDAALRDPGRAPKAVARDPARHPAQELAFFGLRPTDTVVEIWPSGGYWTDILAPYLKARGTYYAAVQAGAGEEDAAGTAFRARVAADPARYGRITVTEAGPGHTTVAPAGSADLILTFRNLHNWMALDSAPALLAGFYRALKPGGTLGIEDHRASDATPQDPHAENGYVRQDYAIKLAEAAGFKFAGSSEINANPRDTKNWPKGVWTLPPTFAMHDQDRAKYAAIGEADNFVLKFTKPGA